SKAIYGANASGKSNLAKAISAFTYVVSRSVAAEGIPQKVWNDRFQLISDWDEQPIFFQYVFSLEEKLFRYGFQVLKEVIHYEWLYENTGEQQQEIFMRAQQQLVIHDPQLTDSTHSIDHVPTEENELFRTDSLYLTAAALTGNRLCALIRNEIRKIVTVDGLDDFHAVNYGIKQFEKNDLRRNAVVELLKAADTGLEGLSVKDTTDGSSETKPNLFSHHTVYDDEGQAVKEITVPFLEWESQGTTKIFSVGSLMIDVLKDGRVMVIDEIDGRLHPNLTLKIVSLFNNPKTNLHGAQLIFVTHDTGLLRRAKLRRDQICFINKDKYGISSLNTLIDFKGIRKDSSFEKDYLNGKYSATPYLDKIDWLFLNKEQ
ncbi:MAG: ATP-binding protein, partial [Sphingobacteriales bacterium]